MRVNIYLEWTDGPIQQYHGKPWECWPPPFISLPKLGPVKAHMEVVGICAYDYFDPHLTLTNGDLVYRQRPIDTQPITCDDRQKEDQP